MHPLSELFWSQHKRTCPGHWPVHKANDHFFHAEYLDTHVRHPVEQESWYPQGDAWLPFYMKQELRLIVEMGHLISLIIAEHMGRVFFK